MLKVGLYAFPDPEVSFPTAHHRQFLIVHEAHDILTRNINAIGKMQHKQSPLLKYLDDQEESMRCFARRIDVPTSTIYRIVNNLTKPYRRTARKIVRASNGKLSLSDFGYE